MSNTNENLSLSSYSISIHINDIIEPISVDVFTAICDRYVYQELNDLLTRYTPITFAYPIYNKKTRATIVLTKIK